MEWLKTYLRRWLGVDVLEKDYNELYQRQATHVKAFNDLVALYNKDAKTLAKLVENWDGLHRQATEALGYANELNATGKRILENFNIAVDVNIHDESWAVVCISGNPSRVYFLDLRGQDVAAIEELLKRYSGTRQATDTPYGMRSIKPITKF